MNNIFDTEVPPTEAEVMQPTPYEPVTTRQSISRRMSAWYDWLVYHVPEKVRKPVSAAYQKMKARVMSFFPQEIKIQALKSGTISTFTIENGGLNGLSPLDFLSSVKPAVVRFLGERPQNKFHFHLVCDMMKVSQATGTVEMENGVSFNSNQESVFGSTDVERTYERATTKILESFATFLRTGSGFVLKKVVRLNIFVAKLKPLRGKSFASLPPWLANRKALVNMGNTDNACFKWAITRALNPVKHNQDRVTKILKLQAEKLDWTGVSFPTPCLERTFRKFEENNNVSLVVLGHSEHKGANVIIPLYASSGRHERVARLFFFKGENGNTHYCVISDISRLLSSQINNHQKKKFICDRCLNGFNSQLRLGEHAKFCSQHEATLTVLPREGENTLKFRNIQNSVEWPIKIYADFESSHTQIDEMHGKTRAHIRHVPVAFCLYVVSRVKGFSMDPVVYVKRSEEESLDKIFTEELEKITRQIYERFKTSVPIIMSESDKVRFQYQPKCYACGGFLNDDRVRDHCHFSGKYRALHNKCNLRLKRSKTIPVLFHNLTSYDCHLLVKRLADTPGEINCIPRNEEKYVTFNKGVHVDTLMKKDGKTVNIYYRLKFMDTLNFMRSSLERLVGNLDKTKLRHTGKFFRNENLDLMVKKGIYPYDYIKGNFYETELPSREEFSTRLNCGLVTSSVDEISEKFNELSPAEITSEEYNRAQKVFETFQCKDLGDYTGLYCKSDVLLLADVFENFIDTCLEKYGLDPTHYITAPSLFWDAMLKKTAVSIELLTDPSMYLFFENGIRGGVSVITNRYAKANNVFMDEFDPKKESVFIEYLDANNLYGWAMCKPLPISDFQWIDENELQEMVNDHSLIKACTLEVDLAYPEELHDLHSDYPLAPEHIVVNETKKLVPNLNGKQNYILHYEALRTYLKHGMKLLKIHRGIKYKESNFLKSYIDFNTASRAQAKSTFESDFFKLANNSVFGKTMENVRLRSKIKLVSQLETNKLEKLIAKPNYRGAHIFENSNLVSVS